jgi:soluble lytic murein transglycosylase
MVKIIVSLLLLLPFGSNPPVLPPTGEDLHQAVMAQIDVRDYAKAAILLNKMKAEEPSRYASLPYSLLHAKTLALAKQPQEAFLQYESVTQDHRLAHFALIPMARIAAAQGVANVAVQQYQEYLRHAYPEYVSVAKEALEYCWQIKNAELLYSTARLVQDRSTMDRVAHLYLGRAYVLRGDKALARNLFLNLISYNKKDDITNLALTELDLIEGTAISAEEKQRRGRLAYDVWNFDLSRKYLEPVSIQNMEAAYYYARTLFFLGDYENSKRTFQVALGLWPDDSKFSQALYQYANVYLREGNYPKASELYEQLKKISNGSMRDNAAFKMIYSLRAQGRLEEALLALAPYTSSRNLTQRGLAMSLRGRIYFQMGRYKDAYAEFQKALALKPFRNQKEVLLWKGMTLEKLDRTTEARNLFLSLAGGTDFYSHKARERIVQQIKHSPPQTSFAIDLPSLPDTSDEPEILSQYEQGNVLPAFLYLRLYEEAGEVLPDVDRETWKILDVSESNRLQRFLGVAYLGALCGNYSTATYYAELFLKNLPRGQTIFSLSPEVLKALFPIPYKDEVERFSRERQLDPFLVLSIMKQESKFKPLARSPAFARGLMQIIPSTAAGLATSLGLQDFSVDQLYIPEVNINLGTRYVQDITREFGNQVEFIAAGYNGGESNVRRWQDSSMKDEVMDFVSSIDFKETKNYVMIVKSNYEIYKQIYGESPVNVPTETSSPQ